MTQDSERIRQALVIARRFGGIDGEHHKAWVIDQMVRALKDEDYEAWADEPWSCDDSVPEVSRQKPA